MDDTTGRGRFTAAYEGEIVVFLIGVRINRLRSWREWWPVVTAMPRMLRELEADPDTGLLGYRMLPGLRQATLIQYWSSVEKLQGFAGDPERSHRPAWIEFFRRSFRGGAVGIWHETYVVPAGAYESVYANIEPLGLAALKGFVPVSRRGDSAAERLTYATPGA